MNTKLKAALITAGIVMGLFLISTIFLFYPNGRIFLLLAIAWTILIRIIYKNIKDELE